MASPTVSEHAPGAGSRASGLAIVLWLAVIGALYLLGFRTGGELEHIMLAGLEPLPFAVLALFAYLALHHAWMRWVALLWLGAIVVVGALLTFSAGAATLLGAEALRAQPQAAPSALPEGDVVRLGGLIGGIGLALVVGFTMFLPSVRRGLGRWVPIDPDSFVHTVALVAIVTITLMSVVPLLVAGQPPLLALIEATDGAGGLAETAGSANGLRDMLYGLVWLVPAAVVAVGLGVTRDLSSALARLGLVRPTRGQVLLGVALGAALVVAVQLYSVVVYAVWDALGWPRTNSEAFEKALAFAINPIGAVVIGVTAGLGEELAVRGVLQPRMGLVLSNAFFAGLHAFQYNWDSLLIVFTLGLVLGLIRRRTNTTTSAIVHGVYDFLLVMLIVVGAPGFS